MIDMPVQHFSRDVADNLRQFDIHLLQGLLHVLDMTGGVTHLHLPLTPVGTQGQHGIRRAKRRTQETVGVQPLDPLRVEHVCLGARCPAGESCPGSHQADRETLGFKEFEQRTPVNAGRFQCDGFHAALFQPSGDLLKIGGVGAELANWVRVAVSGDTQTMFMSECTSIPAAS